MREPLVVRVELLGGFRVSVGARCVDEGRWRLNKAAAIVKILALAPGHRMHREEIADLLWPDLDDRSAANNLHYALHHARRTLEPGGSSTCLRLAGGVVSLRPDGGLSVDVEGFEGAARVARRTNDPSVYRTAVELYAGDLLPRDRYEPWAEERREELRALYVALLVEMAYLCKERGEDEPAIEALTRVLAVEPTHEEAHAKLMRLYAEAGRRAEALAQYERLGEALAAHLDEVPSTGTQRLYEQIQADRVPKRGPPSTRPSPDGAPGASHNLPAARTSFVGRERELIEVKRALATTRLLTLTGAGGSGKTRLALEAAGDVAALYPDGAWLVELATLSEGALVPQVFARILGAREQPGRPITATLADHLRTKNLLLIADNCEHLLEDVAALVDVLLGGCPNLRILATSREPLHVTGEVLWPVRPLSVPERIASRPEDLMSYEAVRLFMDRARQRSPAFSLTPENAGSVSEVCRKLDGMPLAIELATSRLSALPVEQVAEKLGDSLRLLTVRGRTAEPRQRTLRAALDWSYFPLSAVEKRLFERLSVFVGGWTLRAAEMVGGDLEEGPVSGVLDVLSWLVDKSLVTVETRGTFRYGMLEPIRQYAWEKLEGSGEVEDVRSRHATFYMKLAEEAEPELLGARPVPWLERLESEHGNLRSALSWALDGPDAERTAELGLRMATALARFWGVHALSEGRDWLEKGLATAGPSPRVRAAALNQAGWLALFQGEPEKAIGMLEEALDISNHLGDDVGAANALASLGFALAHGGAHERVAELREEAERLQRNLVDRRALARLLEFLTLAALDVHDYERALAYPRKALDLYRELGDEQGVVISLTALGMASLGAGDTEQAAAYLEDNLRLLREVKEKIGISYCLLGLGSVAGERLRAERAARLWGAAEALREATGITLSPLDRSLLHYENRLAAARLLLDEKVWDAAWAYGRAMTPEEAIEYALSSAEPATGRPTKGRPKGPLTRRENEVALLVARGLTNRQISTELAISENTVANHVAHILKKLDLSSRSQLAVWVTEQGLRPPDP